MTRRSTVPVRNATEARPAGRFGRSALALLVGASGVFVGASLDVHGADAQTSVAAKRAQIAHLRAQLDANGEQISILDERINAAGIRIAKLKRELAGAEKQAKAAAQSAGALRGSMAERASAIYRGAGTSIGLNSSSTSVSQQGAMAVYSQAAASQDAHRVSIYRNAHDRAARASRLVAAAKKQTEQLNGDLNRSRRNLESINSRATQLEAQLNANLTVQLRREEEARQLAARAAAARRIAAARSAQANRGSRSNRGGGSVDTNTGVDPGPGPAVSSRVGAVLSVARAQLGKRYVYATAGPNTFDCSGLLLYAWRLGAGVSMPHSAASQYYMFPHVSVASIQPGDLIAYGSPIHHIGMYVGGGTMIEAPHSGAVVRYASIFRRDMVGVARP